MFNTWEPCSPYKYVDYIHPYYTTSDLILNGFNPVTSILTKSIINSYHWELDERTLLIGVERFLAPICDG